MKITKEIEEMVDVFEYEMLSSTALVESKWEAISEEDSIEIGKLKTGESCAFCMTASKLFCDRLNQESERLVDACDICPVMLVLLDKCPKKDSIYNKVAIEFKDTGVVSKEGIQNIFKAIKEIKNSFKNKIFRKNLIDFIRSL